MIQGRVTCIFVVSFYSGPERCKKISRGYRRINAENIYSALLKFNVTKIEL